MSSFDFSKSFQSIQGSVSDLGSQFTPFAKRTQRIIQEKLGNAGDVTELPEEYLELERRVDALKTVHQKLLAVTSQYENESYDYPPNLRESVTDLSKTIAEKVSTLSHAGSVQEAEAILTSSSGKKEPKTLNHALGRAALAGSEALTAANLAKPVESDASSSASQPPLAVALQKYAVAEEKVGEARLAQDQLIVTKANASLATTLNSSLHFAAKARKNVHNARLNLDAAKATAKSAKPEKQAAARVEVERVEDEFVAATEEAVSVMKNVLDTPEPLKDLVEIAKAQLEFHKQAAKTLEEVLPELEQLQTDQEAIYRATRD